MKKALLLLAVLFSWQAPLCAGEIKQIELSDGSVVNARVISLSNGVYTLDAGSLGEIKVDASKVVNILSAGSPSSKAQDNTADVKTQIEQYQEQVLNNPQIMGIAQELAQDPQFQEIMNDPQIIEAIQSGNIGALMSNEKFMNLMDNPKIKDIGNSLQTGR